MKKNKYLILAFLIILLILKAGFIYAMEIKYPVLTAIKLPDINQANTTLAQDVAYFFGLGVYVVGVISLISFSVGAIELLFSLGNSTIASEGKDRMKSSLIGIVIAVLAVLLLNFINSNIANTKLNPLPAPAVNNTSSVFFTNSSSDKAPKISADNNKSIGDLSTFLPKGYDTINYVCGTAGGKDIIVWSYSATNFANISSSSATIIKCGGGVNIKNDLSLEWDYKNPGVYFCTGGCDGTACVGGMSKVITGDQDPIDDTFSEKIKGIMIVEDASTQTRFGVILHDGPLGDTGKCSLPIYDTSSSNDSVCNTVDSALNATSANIFTIGNNSAGNGANFYSDIDGWANTINSGTDISAVAGIYKITPDKINPVFNGNAGSMVYDFSNSNVPQGEQDVCKTLKDCMGSFELKGGYLAAIYSGSGSGSDTNAYCRTFTESQLNTTILGVVGQSASQIGNVYVFSTK